MDHNVHKFIIKTKNLPVYYINMPLIGEFETAGSGGGRMESGLSCIKIKFLPDSRPRTSDHLQIPSCRLLSLNGFEQCFEIALAKTFCTFTLDDFKK